MKKSQRKDNGFTLVEIMVSLAISSLVIAGIYGVYTIQQRSYTVQEQVSEMQQRARSALDFMARTVRMAGYNPDGNSKCSSSLVIADADSLAFDICEENEPEYRYTIAYNAGSGTLNVISDMDIDGGDSSMPLAEDIDAFRFRYLESDGTVLSSVPLNDNDRKKVKILQISLLARATYPDPKYTDTITYIPEPSGSASDWTLKGGANPPNDNYHRRLLTTSIALRNM